MKKKAYDTVDLFVTEWRRERPDLDAALPGITDRILRLAGHVNRLKADALRRFHLSPGDFDVLGALRRTPTPRTPTGLSRTLMISSGGMTKRLDQLERLGLIERRRNPADRRGVFPELTSRGREVCDEAAHILFERLAPLIARLQAREKAALSNLLSHLLLAFEQEIAPGDMTPP